MSLSNYPAWNISLLWGWQETARRIHAVQFALEVCEGDDLSSERSYRVVPRLSGTRATMATAS